MGPGPSFRRKPESMWLLHATAADGSKMDPSVRWDDDGYIAMKSSAP